ncbi:metallophosphoesterase family protein, partial [Staphylococcus epidermidis]|nr:metallophosphoesterase family protein [Klebsiella sp.]
KGKKILFIHYEIENDKMSAPIDEQPFAPITKDDEQAISELFKDKEADLILFGHNHRLHMFDDKSTVYFNPGSVGLNNGSNTVYGIITVNEKGISVERVKLAYNNEEFLAGFEEKQVPAREFIFKNFI